MATKEEVPKHDKAFSIEHDRDSCIGCGACVAVCDNFRMDDDGKASIKIVDMDDLKENKDAAESCPVNCVRIIDNKTKKKIV